MKIHYPTSVVSSPGVVWPSEGCLALSEDAFYSYCQGGALLKSAEGVLNTIPFPKIIHWCWDGEISVMMLPLIKHHLTHDRWVMKTLAEEMVFMKRMLCVSTCWAVWTH